MRRPQNCVRRASTSRASLRTRGGASLSCSACLAVFTSCSTSLATRWPRARVQVAEQDSQAIDGPVPGGAGDGEPVDPRYRDLRRLGMRLFAAGAACGTLLVVAILIAAADDLRAWIGIPLVTAWLIFVGALAWHAERWP